MNTTIIPFFLLAYTLNNITWPNGSEYKFTVLTEVKMPVNENVALFNFNVTNELTCQVRQENVISCDFKPVNLSVAEYDAKIKGMRQRSILANEIPLYGSFSFDLGFDNKGVCKIIANKNVTKDERIDIAKIIVNLLNVGVDLSDLQFKENGDLIKLFQEDNLIQRRCMVDVTIGLDNKFDDLQEGSWSLELMPPLEKLFNRRIDITKNWKVSNCHLEKSFAWTYPKIAGILQDPRMNVTNFSGLMTVDRYTFVSSISLHLMKFFEGEEVKIVQFMTLTLDAIYAAQKEWPEIDEPIIISC